jgi:hypothetical protein
MNYFRIVPGRPLAVVSTLSIEVSDRSSGILSPSTDGNPPANLPKVAISARHWNPLTLSYQTDADLWAWCGNWDL